MNKYNDIACTYSKIQKELKISKTSLTKAISILKKHNFILAKKVGSGNYYSINGKIVWGSWGTNYKLCKFVAPIVIADNTNEVEEDK
jgi:DNA-binding transcriptional ArsR family regulator